MKTHGILFAAIIWQIVICQVTVAEDPSPVGTWKWQSELGDNKIDSVLRLELNGKTLSGSYKDQNVEKRIEKAVFEGNRIRFQFDVTPNDRTVTIRFDGELKKDRLVGQVVIAASGEDYKFDWNAKRGLVHDDVVGTWQFDFVDPEGNRRKPIAKIVAEENKTLKGQIESELGTVDVDKIRIDGGEFTMGHEIDFNGQTVKLVYVCAPRGDKLTGKIKYELGGDEGDFEIAASREKKKPSKKAATKN